MTTTRLVCVGDSFTEGMCDDLRPDGHHIGWSDPVAYALARQNPFPSLAARLAAKEAFQKCWPESLSWKEVWVGMEGKRPALRFAPRIEARMAEEGLFAHLSLSHERSHALAVVVLEARARGGG